MSATTSAKHIPKDAQVITAILKEFGINEFDPRVIHQLLEFIYGHTSIILDEARVFANHAKKKNVDVDDVKLAIQMHAEQLSSAGPPRDILLELARGKNSTSLPPIKPQSGIRLPPDRYCLTQPNYKLKSNLPNTIKKSSKSFTNVINVSNTGSSPTTTSITTNKQMPMIPSRTTPLITVKSKNILPETLVNCVTTTVLPSEGNPTEPEIKPKIDTDLMEIDPLNSEI